MKINSSGSSFLIDLLNKNEGTKAKSFAKLSSGSRITTASDDAAGLAVVAQLTAQSTQLGQASRNVSDSQSAINIADGALEQIGNISSRLSELATQASNGTLSDSQRGALQEEFSQLTQEATRITQTTEFNGTNLLSGSSSTAQVGTDSSSDSQIVIANANPGSDIAALSVQNITTQDGARAALDQINSFISSTAQSRGTLGAIDSRLSVADSSAKSRKVEVEAAASRIRDVDVADETAKLVATNIRSQANIATIAQASKLNKDSVLRLLS